MMQLLKLSELWKLLFDKQDDSVSFIMPDIRMKLKTHCPLTAAKLKRFPVVLVKYGCRCWVPLNVCEISEIVLIIVSFVNIFVM